VLGGLGWLLLAPDAELARRDQLSYDAYNRLVAVPLLLFTVTLALTPRVLAVRSRVARAGLVVVAVGAGLLVLGNGIEFYGVLLQDRPNAYAGYQAGQESWIGSHVGWAVYLIGGLVLLAGSIAAAGLAFGRTRPGWLTAFVAALAIGVLSGSFLGLGPAYVSAPVLALYAAAWIGFGRWLRRAGAGTAVR
jgi:hypothetical protein